MMEASSNLSSILDHALTLDTDSNMMTVFMHKHFVEQQDLLKTMDEASGSVMHILNDVLSLQKIEEGHMSYEMKPLSLTDLTETMFKRSKHLMLQKDINLECSIDPTMLKRKVAGDYHRLMQVHTH